MYLCRPEEKPPEMPNIKGGKILIDSNLYPYHDYAFELARYNEVYITRRSLTGLDRARAYLMELELKKLGAIFIDKIEDENKFDLILKEFRREQPTIGLSIKKGYILGRALKNT